MAGKITRGAGGVLNVPDYPVIPFIEGDGTGPDIWRAARTVLEKSVEFAYQGRRKIEFMELVAGEKAYRQCGEWLPQETLDAIRDYRVIIKGPLSTPIGGGIRSVNVALRQRLDLYACIRPVRYFSGVPSPMKHPEKIDMVIFRENIEDVYSGIEWEAGSNQAKKALAFVKTMTGTDLYPNTGIGIKPISDVNSKRLVRMAIRYALENDRKSVTLMHKGNIMKFTEGAFARWGYEVAAGEFPDRLVTEEDLFGKYEGRMPEGKILFKDRIADNLFQQVLLRPEEYDIIAAPNLNGDYISDALAAQTGGLGLSPGANIGDDCAIFEATHGTAPRYAGLDKVNPGSVILSGAMLFDHIGWHEAAELLQNGVQGTISANTVTYDLARQMPGATELRCSEFGDAVCRTMQTLAA